MTKLMVIMMLTITGCSTVSQDLKAGSFYKRDIKLTVNDISATGGLIVPKASSYKIEASSEKGNFDFVIFDTCHKYYALPEKQGDDFTTVFTPRPGIEDIGACPIKIHSFDKDHSRDAFGFIGFESPEFNLTAITECNDLPKSKAKTVSYCEVKPGHPMRITFTEVVVWGADKTKPECVIAEAKDNMTFQFSLPRGDCQFLFQARSDASKKHLLYTYGFDEILPRRF